MANQQLRNTGTKIFFSGSQKIFREEEKKEKNVRDIKLLSISKKKRKGRGVLGC